jgi:CMP/dCMP kinase
MTTKIQRRRIVVAIDGPAGAGKSTVAKKLAAVLGYRFLDTGAIYRSLALVARRNGTDWGDEAGLTELARGLDIRFCPVEGVDRVFVGDEDVSEAIRTPEISQGASMVSAVPGVRAALLDVQRRLGAGGGIVAEGRDVGTVVFPRAAAKFFLTASDEVRAQRRFDELVANGASAHIDDVQAEIAERDSRDRGRAVAPLRQAPDAVAIDSSSSSVDAVVRSMARLVRTRELARFTGS